MKIIQLLIVVYLTYVLAIFVFASIFLVYTIPEQINLSK